MPPHRRWGPWILRGDDGAILAETNFMSDDRFAIVTVAAATTESGSYSSLFRESKALKQLRCQRKLSFPRSILMYHQPGIQYSNQHSLSFK